MTDKERTEKIKKYFKYAYTGTITNVHGYYTMNFAGSDFDMDILAQTNNENVIRGKYSNQRVVTYDVKKPHKKVFSEYDLYLSDTFSFSSLIGSLTNLISNCVGLMANFPKESKERKWLEDRVRAGCAAQSRQMGLIRL